MPLPKAAATRAITTVTAKAPTPAERKAVAKAGQRGAAARAAATLTTTTTTAPERPAPKPIRRHSLSSVAAGKRPASTRRRVRFFLPPKGPVSVPEPGALLPLDLIQIAVKRDKCLTDDQVVMKFWKVYNLLSAATQDRADIRRCHMAWRVWNYIHVRGSIDLDLAVKMWNQCTLDC
ncbi:hypothetical protein CLAIMM_02387 [Cladophialophora immunda]|nr:hypothetical protein CLAIMM_02387 [Cladophialophora immunda]